MANISAIKLPDNSNYDLRASAIPFGIVDSSSTSTAFTVTVPGITALEDGVICMLKNGKVTSAAGFTINVNGLGAKPVYSNMAAATADTTIFNVNYTMIFVYDETRVEGGCWICYRGFNSNDNTIGYQIRTGSLSLPVSGATGRYRILFTSPDGTHFVPPTLSTSTNATAKRDVNTAKIDPFGRIVYYSSTTILSAEERPGASSLWQQYTFALGYSFNRTGAALTMTLWKPVFVKCAPQSDGSAIIDADTPFVQDLPSTEDGKIYIWLGIAYSATNIELTLEHPVYEYKDGKISQYTNTSKGVTGAKGSGAITVAPPSDTQGAYSIGDITISHSTQEGYKHIPSGGSAGQILGYGGSGGTASWVAKPTYTFSEIDSKPTTISGYGITDAKIASGTITLGSNTITPLTSSSTLNAAKLSGAIPSAVTATTQTAGDNSTKIATTAFVSSAISGLPTPMQFIGTVGTNGTTTWANLPTASGHNGYTYKVITAHTAETGKPAADVGDALISNGTEWIVIPAGDETATQSATTGISIAAHGTGTVIGVQSSTTTASKVTVGSHSTDYGIKSAGSASTWTFEEKTIPNVTSAGTASSWTFEEKTIPNVTAAGSGSASLTFAMDTTDTKKLKITFSHTHTAPTIGTAIKVQSKSGGSNGTAPTLGTAIKVQSKSGGANSTAPTLGSKVPTVSATDVTVPIKNASASTFVTGTTHTVTDNGHTHTI